MSPDNRTQNKQILDQIETTILARATDNVAGYTIGTRQLDYIPMRELMRLRATYITAVRRETGKLFGKVKLVDA